MSTRRCCGGGEPERDAAAHDAHRAEADGEAGECLARQVADAERADQRRLLDGEGDQERGADLGQRLEELLREALVEIRNERDERSAAYEGDPDPEEDAALSRGGPPQQGKLPQAPVHSGPQPTAYRGRTECVT